MNSLSNKIEWLQFEISDLKRVETKTERERDGEGWGWGKAFSPIAWHHMYRLRSTTLIIDMKLQSIKCKEEREREKDTWVCILRLLLLLLYSDVGKAIFKNNDAGRQKMFDSALARTFTTVGKILERHFAAQQTVDSSNFSVRVKEFVHMQHGG